MARQQRVDWGDGEGVGESHADQDEKCFNNWGRMSQNNGIAEEANDRLCPRNGVEHEMDSDCAGGHLLVRSSANGSVIEGEDLEEDDVDGSFKGGKGGGVEDEEVRMSRLEVPRSLYSSNILGLSQETDSDAESIR